MLRRLSIGYLAVRRSANLLPLARRYPTRCFVVSSGSHDSENRPEWRKQQLDSLESKFAAATASSSLENQIQDDEDLQPMWRDMESRVRNRRSLTLAENKGKIGRANIRKTDEDVWLQEGLYNDDDGEGGKGDK